MRWIRSIRAAVRAAACLAWACAALGGSTALAAATAGTADASAPTAADFARWPALDDVVPSPSGRRMAFIVHGGKGFRQLATMELDPITAPRVVANYSNADVTHVRWADDERLVYTVFQRGPVIDRNGGGLYAVDHDGSSQIRLAGPFSWRLHSTLDDGSGDVLVTLPIAKSTGELISVHLDRLDSRTGVYRNLNVVIPHGTRQWHVDPTGKRRFITAVKDGRARLYRHDAVDSKWILVREYDAIEGPSVTPWHIDPAGDVIVRAGARGQADTLHRMDPVSGRLDVDPLVAVAGFDVAATPAVDSMSGRLLGLHFTADRPLSVWFDDDMQRLQAGIDAAMPPGRTNRLLCGRCKTSRFIIVYSSSDRHPGEYLLFDRQEGQLKTIGAVRPWLPESSQGRRTFHRIAARDGLMLPLVVTHPPGATDDDRRPAVVLVHGGPWVRGGSVAWDAQAQFLATRGWRVLQPEFRGSTGFGDQLFRAGWKQWGRAMQDDLLDAVRWAADRGWVDASKVCIVGASYGGYAALIGPVVQPDAWRCAASFAGITDIDLLYSVHWSDLPDESRRHGMPQMIGDRDLDAARLAEVSPLKRAGEIRTPVLMSHGVLDRRVPMEHFNRFRSAAETAQAPIEFVVYPDDAHGFYSEQSQADWYQRLEKFIGQALNAPSP